MRCVACIEIRSLADGQLAIASTGYVGAAAITGNGMGDASDTALSAAF